MDQQVLTAKQVGDVRGWPRWEVYSDELGYLGVYGGLYASDAIAEAREDLL